MFRIFNIDIIYYVKREFYKPNNLSKANFSLLSLQQRLNSGASKTDIFLALIFRHFFQLLVSETL